MATAFVPRFAAAAAKPTNCWATAFAPRFAAAAAKPTNCWARLTTVKTLTRSNIEEALHYAKNVALASQACGPWRDPRGQPKALDLLHGRVLANLFFEPSTRTSSSFAAAMMRMGGQVLDLNMANSSGKKGETLSDTVRVMSEYADCVVIRHPDKDVFEQIGEHGCPVPLINAGNGADEHPTQALLDLLTMQMELGAPSLDGVTVTLVGDLKHGRTVHSLATLLGRFDGVTLNLVTPRALAMPDEWHDQIAAAGGAGVKVRELDDFADALRQTDVLYMTRVQRERFESEAAYDAVKGAFTLSAADLEGSRALVLHPLPRVDEIAPSVDATPNARYFEQAGYGVAMRMALLGLAMGAPPPDFGHIGPMDSGD